MSCTLEILAGLIAPTSSYPPTFNLNLPVPIPSDQQYQSVIEITIPQHPNLTMSASTSNDPNPQLTVPGHANGIENGIEVATVGPIATALAPALYKPPYPPLYALPAPPAMKFPGKTRANRKAMIRYMKAYGLPHGYRLAVGSTKPGILDVHFSCSCFGAPPDPPNRSKRCHCLFKYTARWIPEDEEWHLYPVKQLHSHPADPNIKPHHSRSDDELDAPDVSHYLLFPIHRAFFFQKFNCSCSLSRPFSRCFCCLLV